MVPLVIDVIVVLFSGYVIAYDVCYLVLYDGLVLGFELCSLLRLFC